jgi:hypothetical protein
MSEMHYIGKLGGVLVSAPTRFIVRFADGQTLDFPTLDDARGFLRFYNTSPTARLKNPATVYSLRDRVWEEKVCAPKIEPDSRSNRFEKRSVGRDAR